jgi:thiamine-phosphate pyrophosphorylase
MVTAPQGLGRLERYAQLMKAYPLVAIGGIDLEQLPAVVKTGVGSVAVVRAIIASESPEATAQALMLNLL